MGVWNFLNGRMLSTNSSKSPKPLAEVLMQTAGPCPTPHSGREVGFSVDQPKFATPMAGHTENTADNSLGRLAMELRNS